MFASSGYFRGLTCPFFANGLCERPYCHFRHVKPEEKKFTTDLEGSSNLGHSSGMLLSDSSSAVQCPTPVVHKPSMLNMVGVASQHLSYHSTHNRSKPKVEAKANIPQYTPTPIYLLNQMKKNQSLEYDPMSNFSSKIETSTSIQRICLGDVENFGSKRKYTVDGSTEDQVIEVKKQKVSTNSEESSFAVPSVDVVAEITKDKCIESLTSCSTAESTRLKQNEINNADIIMSNLVSVSSGIDSGDADQSKKILINAENKVLKSGVWEGGEGTSAGDIALDSSLGNNVLSNSKSDLTDKKTNLIQKDSMSSKESKTAKEIKSSKESRSAIDSESRSTKELGSRSCKESDSRSVKESDSRSTKDSESRSCKESESRSCKESYSRSAKESDSRSTKDSESRSCKESESRSSKESDSRSTKESESKSTKEMGSTKESRSSSKESRSGSSSKDIKPGSSSREHKSSKKVRSSKESRSHNSNSVKQSCKSSHSDKYKEHKNSHKTSDKEAQSTCSNKSENSKSNSDSDGKSDTSRCNTDPDESKLSKSRSRTNGHHKTSDMSGSGKMSEHHQVDKQVSYKEINLANDRENLKLGKPVKTTNSKESFCGNDINNLQLDSYIPENKKTNDSLVAVDAGKKVKLKDECPDRSKEKSSKDLDRISSVTDGKLICLDSLHSMKDYKLIRSDSSHSTIDHKPSYPSKNDKSSHSQKDHRSSHSNKDHKASYSTKDHKSTKDYKSSHSTKDHKSAQSIKDHKSSHSQKDYKSLHSDDSNSEVKLISSHKIEHKSTNSHTSTDSTKKDKSTDYRKSSHLTSSTLKDNKSSSYAKELNSVSCSNNLKRSTIGSSNVKAFKRGISQVELFGEDSDTEADCGLMSPPAKVPALKRSRSVSISVSNDSDESLLLRESLDEMDNDFNDAEVSTYDECFELFKEETEKRRNGHHNKDNSVVQKLKHEAIPEPTVPAKQRVAHASQNGEPRFVPKVVKKILSLTPAQIMLNRIKELQSGSSTSDDNNSQSLEMPKSQQKSSSSMNSSITAAPMIKQKSEEFSVLSSKNTSRVAHKPDKIVLKRPVVACDSGSKIPVNVRQRYLNLFIDECLKLYDDEQDAHTRGLAEEKAAYDGSSTKTIYLSRASNAIGRLRKEATPVNGLSAKNPNALSHEAVLNGARGALTSFTVNRCGKIMEQLPKSLKGLDLYKRLEGYILTEEDLIENGFPRFDPNTDKIVMKVTARSPTKPVSSNSNEKVCCRCGKRFVIHDDGTFARDEECIYHWGRAWKRRVNGAMDNVYTCCQGDLSSNGCQSAKYHVHEGNKMEDLKGYMKTLPCSPPPDGFYGVFALDCEMVYTTAGSELARITVIDSDLKSVYEKLVKPDHPVLDYNTRFSGITAEDLSSVQTNIRNVQAVLLNMFNDRTILIGHSLESDFVALKLVHNTVVDTSVVFPHRLGLPAKRALKNLASEILQKIIQNNVDGHDSREDAVACMDLMIWKIKDDAKRGFRPN